MDYVKENIYYLNMKELKKLSDFMDVPYEIFLE